MVWPIAGHCGESAIRSRPVVVPTPGSDPPAKLPDKLAAHLGNEPRRVPPPDRSFWELLPRRNFRRVLFLIFALLGVLAIKRAGGLSLSRLFDGVAPAPASAGRDTGRDAQGHFQHLEVKR